MECQKAAVRQQQTMTPAITVRVEINAQTMQRLLALDVLCAQDFRCLDKVSKGCIQRLFLNNCARCVATATSKLV